VLSDAPSKLVTTNRFVAAPSGCNTMIDPQGATLSYGYGSAGAEHLWTNEVERSDYMVTSTRFAIWDIPPDAALRAYVSANFQLVRDGGLLFYVRKRLSARRRRGRGAGIAIGWTGRVTTPRGDLAGSNSADHGRVGSHCEVDGVGDVAQVVRPLVQCEWPDPSSRASRS